MAAKGPNSPVPPTQDYPNAPPPYSPRSPTFNSPNVFEMTSPPGSGIQSSLMKESGFIENGLLGNKTPAELLHSSAKASRTLFLRKVFGIISCQTIIALLIVVGCIYIPAINEGMDPDHISAFLFWSLWTLGFIIISFVMASCKNFMRKPPMDLVLVGLITIGIGLALGTLSARLANENILIEIGIVASICICEVGFTFQQKYQFTPMISISFTWALLLLTYGFLNIGFSPEDAAFILIPPAAFLTYLIVGTQILVKNDDKALTSAEIYFGAALITMCLISAISTGTRHILGIIPCCRCIKPEPKSALNGHANTSIIINVRG